jgi:hypothetical protein
MNSRIQSGGTKSIINLLKDSDQIKLFQKESPDRNFGAFVR